MGYSGKDENLIAGYEITADRVIPELYKDPIALKLLFTQGKETLEAIGMSFVSQTELVKRMGRAPVEWALLYTLDATSTFEGVQDVTKKFNSNKLGKIEHNQCLFVK